MFDVRWRGTVARAPSSSRGEGAAADSAHARDDLRAAVFPDQPLQENIGGDIRIPDHPRNETIKDCLGGMTWTDEADSEDISTGTMKQSRSIPGASHFSHEFSTRIHTRPRDAPLEERRAARRADAAHEARAGGVGALDPAAIAASRRSFRRAEAKSGTMSAHDGFAPPFAIGRVFRPLRE